MATPPKPLLLRRVFASGVPQLLLSLSVVQGSAYVGQLLLAGMLSPDQFAVVRTGEVLVAILLLVATAGLPSQVVTELAVVDAEARRNLLGWYTRLAAAAGAIVALAGALLVWLLWRGTEGALLGAVAATVAVTAINRTLLASFHAARRFDAYLSITVAATALALSTLIALVAAAGLPGWVAARWLGELALLVGLVWTLRGAVALRGAAPPDHRAAVVVLRGAGISLSMALRVLIDNVPLFAVTALGRPGDEVGAVGLATLAAACTLFVPAALIAAAFPALVRDLREAPRAGWHAYRRLQIRTVASAGLAAIAIGSGAALVPYVLGPRYAPAVVLVAVLVTAAVVRAAVTAAGSVLLALRRTDLSARGQLAMLGVSAAGMLVVVPRWGAVGAVWAALAVEIGGAVWLLTRTGRLRTAASVGSFG